MDLLQLLQDPGREFTPIPFWFLNGDLRVEELRRQLRDFCDHGVYGVVLHPRIGLPKRIGYLSPSFFGYIHAAVREAADLGMTVVLYDEGMYPSGSAGGQVVDGHPELRSVGLAQVSEPAAGDTVLCQTPTGFLVERPSGGTIRGLHWGEDDGEPYAPPSADILNPAAVDRFISLTHEAYYRELKEWFGTTIIGFFTDEPSILGRNVQDMQPWTHGFAEDFAAAGGKIENLAALFAGQKNPDTERYHRMLLERESRVYYGKLSDWCAGHGIALMGHPHQSDDIEVERYFHIPGQDLALRWVAPETGGLTGLDSTMGKCSADAAFLAGRRRNSNECFGACNRDGNPWQVSGGDIKWYLDWLAVRGVNLFIPHAFYYSIAGKRKDERPPDVGPNSMWWPYYEQWSRYMRRLSCLMTDIDLYAPAAVLCRNRDLRPETVAPLFEHQIGFRYLPAGDWPRCTLRDGALWLDEHRFEGVMGEEEAYPELPRRTWRDFTPDLVCEPAAPALRCAHFQRAGTECWFLVNEGEETIDTALTLPCGTPVGRYDLWRGEAVRMPQPLRLHLKRRESVLLFACTPAEYEALPEMVEPLALPVPRFALSQQDDKSARRTYTAELRADAGQCAHAHPTLTLHAEEMAELYVNDRPAGAGFWQPQAFDLAGLLHEGENHLTLVVTGSPANRYGRPVPYGLTQE